MIILSFVILCLAAAGFLARLVLGPSIADRIIALNGVLLVVVSILAVDAARTGRAIFGDAIIVVALLGFVGTSIGALFIERKGG